MADICRKNLPHLSYIKLVFGKIKKQQVQSICKVQKMGAYIEKQILRERTGRNGISVPVILVMGMKEIGKPGLSYILIYIILYCLNLLQ